MTGRASRPTFLFHPSTGETPVPLFWRPPAASNSSEPVSAILDDTTDFLGPSLQNPFDYARQFRCFLARNEFVASAIA